MIIIGITGFFCSGKSSVMQIFESAGAFTLGLDDLYADLLDVDANLQNKLQGLLGRAVKIDKEILRSGLSDNVFSIEELSDVTHPFIIQKLDEKIKQFRQKTGNGVLVVEVPLLYEAGLETMFDKVVVVAAERRICLQRAVSRGYTESQAEMIMQAQMSIDEKINRADYVIDNNKDMKNLEKQIGEFYAKEKK